jgi:protein-disulfide isomerase
MTENNDVKENKPHTDSHTQTHHHSTPHVQKPVMVTMSKSELTKNYVLVFLVTAIVVFGISWLSLGGSNSGVSAGNVNAPSKAAAPTPTAAPSPSAPAERVDLDLSLAAASLGDEDAPVVIAEFSDYQCPFCSRFAQQTKATIESSYVDDGTVQFLYYDFPLESIHPEATPAALAARCAGEQGKYWEYHDLLFQNQQTLSASNYDVWAGQLGLDTSKFSECVSSEKYSEEVQENLKVGSLGGIRGTPGFLINGRAVSGACPFSTFDEVVQAELDGTEWSVTNCQVTTY